MKSTQGKCWICDKDFVLVEQLQVHLQNEHKMKEATSVEKAKELEEDHRKQLEQKRKWKGSNVQLQREGKAMMMMMMTTIRTTSRESWEGRMTTQTTAPARNSSRRLTSEGISKGKRLGQVKQD